MASSSLQNITEIKVFLKCQNCGSFLTSQALPIIKKHFDSCQPAKIENSSSSRLHVKAESEPLDTQCDLIDEKMETITLPQMIVKLKRVNLEQLKLNPSKEFETQVKNNDTNPIHHLTSLTRTRYQNESPVEIKKRRLTSHQVPQDLTETPKLTSDPPRKSRLKAQQKLSEVMNLEQGPEHDYYSDDDDEWEFGNESEDIPSSKRVSKNKRQPNETKEEQKLLGLGKIATCAHKDPNYPFKCQVCTARYKSQEHLTLHNQTVHENKNAELQFSCSICRRMFSKRLPFQAHLKRHENAEDAETGFNIWTKWPKPPKNGPDKNIVFNCKYCLMPHSSHRTFLSHMNSAHSDKGRHFIFQCPYACSSRLDSIKQLTTHIKSAHVNIYYGKTLKWDEATTHELGRPKKECDACGKLFEIYYLAQHKALFHSANSVPKRQPESIYNCPFPGCAITCSNDILLKGHFILHLYNNPYVCPLKGCVVKVDSPCHLKRHIKLHLDVPPVCPKCGVSYASKRKFKFHKCDDNVEKIKSGEHKLVKIGKSWRLKPLGKVRSSETSEVNELPETFDMKKYMDSMRKIDINSIIRKDPVFIQACEDDPEFEQVIQLGRKQYTRSDKPRAPNPRQRSRPSPKKDNTSPSVEGNEVRKSGRKRKATKYFDDDDDYNLPEKISPRLLDNKEEVVRIKVEPDIIIGLHTTENGDLNLNQDWDQIGKYETDKFM